MDLLMDDKIDAAEKYLENGTSNYHKVSMQIYPEAGRMQS